MALSDEELCGYLLLTHGTVLESVCMEWKRAALAPARLQHGMQSIRKKQIRRSKASKDQEGSSRRKMREALQTSSIREAEPGRESGGKQNHQGRTSVKIAHLLSRRATTFFRQCWPMLACDNNFFLVTASLGNNILFVTAGLLFAYKKRDVTLPSVPMPQVWEQRR